MQHSKFVIGQSVVYSPSGNKQFSFPYKVAVVNNETLTLVDEDADFMFEVDASKVSHDSVMIKPSGTALPFGSTVSEQHMVDNMR